MTKYKYLGEIFESRKDLKIKTGFSSCKIDAKIRDGKITKIEGKANEILHNNSQYSSK